VRSNLGAETRATYAPSTRFYLEDKGSRAPWVTRALPGLDSRRTETID
jgi:hypothetical protein